MAIEREKLFGTDLQLAERANGLDLISNPAGDLALARGAENIAQALELRLRVHKGELAPLGWPDYGSRIYELIGELNNTRTHIKLMAFARSAIEADPRVLEVTNIRAEPRERSVVRLELEIELIHEPNPLNMVVDLNLEAL